MRFIIAVLACVAIAADKPKISKVSVVPATKEKQVDASVKPMSVPARCSSCSEAITGTLKVTDKRVSFCCTSWEAPEGIAKATAVCPWSFEVALSDVEAQYLDSEGDVWHLVTKAGVDYAFASEKIEAMQSAFEMIRVAQPDLPANKLVAKFAEKVMPPKLVEQKCAQR